MQSDAERTLSNLNVLSALSQNDKLMTNDAGFDIYTPTSIRGIARLWYGEGRVQNIQRIRSTVHSGVAFCERCLTEISCMNHAPREGGGMNLRMCNVSLQYLRMLDALTRSRTGLTNLLQTYRDDAANVSQITMIVHEIDDFLKLMDSYTRNVRQSLSCGSSFQESSEAVHHAVL